MSGIGLGEVGRQVAAELDVAAGGALDRVLDALVRRGPRRGCRRSR